jgi:hypothetical protein
LVFVAPAITARPLRVRAFDHVETSDELVAIDGTALRLNEIVAQVGGIQIRYLVKLEEFSRCRIEPRGGNHVPGKRKRGSHVVGYGAGARIEDAVRLPGVARGKSKQLAEVAALHSGGSESIHRLHLAALTEPFVVRHEEQAVLAV